MPQVWILLLLGGVVAASEPRADPDPNRFAAEIKAFAEWDSKNAAPAHPVLFVGSSTIRLWRTHDSFPQWPVLNRGFGGSHISDVLHFTDRVVLPYQPQVIVFYAGDNDIAAGKSAERVRADYRRFVGLVHARWPQTRILFLGIKPSRARWKLWPEMKKANDLIQELGRNDSRLLCADLSAPLLGSDGLPVPALFLADQLHLSPKGYEAWSKALAPVLEKALASAPAPRS
jgi:lysophospholipase L1-like esterase